MDDAATTKGDASMRQDQLSTGGRRASLPRFRFSTARPAPLGGLAARISRGLATASLLLSAGLVLAGGGPLPVQAAPLALNSGATSISVNADIPPSDDGLVHLKLIPGANEARYTMQISTLGQPAKAASCTTNNVTGDIVMTTDGVIVPELSKITVDMRNLNCEPPLSNARAQSLLETNKFPFAEFVIQQAPGMTLPLPDGQTTSLQYVGDQTVHGVTRPVEYASTSTALGAEVSGQSSTMIKMTDFNMKPPSIGPLVQVADEMAVDMTFKAAVSAPPAADAAAPADEAGQ